MYEGDKVSFSGALTLDDHQTYQARSLRSSSNPAHLDMRTDRMNFTLKSARKLNDMAPTEALELKD